MAAHTTRTQEWVEAFFARAGPRLMRHPSRQVAIVEPPTYNILSRTNSTVHITFTYDPHVTFMVNPAAAADDDDVTSDLLDLLDLLMMMGQSQSSPAEPSSSRLMAFRVMMTHLMSRAASGLG